MAALELENRATLAATDGSIRTLKHDLLELTRTNSTYLASIANLKADSKMHERALNMAQQDAGADDTHVQQAEKQERAHLLAELRDQVIEIEHLHMEIRRLAHKGGHVAPPTKPSSIAPLPPI